MPEAGMASATRSVESTPPLDGANSGTLAVRGAVFHEVMEAWRDLDESEPLRNSGFRDQASWNALLLRRSDRGGEMAARMAAATRRAGSTPPPGGGGWKAAAFPAGEVQFPSCMDPHDTGGGRAALTRNILPEPLERTRFTFGLSLRTFYCGPTGLFFPLLEI